MLKISQKILSSDFPNVAKYTWIIKMHQPHLARGGNARDDD